MDKADEDVFRAHGLPVAPLFVVTRAEWESNPEDVQIRAERRADLPDVRQARQHGVERRGEQDTRCRPSSPLLSTWRRAMTAA